MQDSGLNEIIPLMYILTIRDSINILFSYILKPLKTRIWGWLQWLMPGWPQHLLLLIWPGAILHRHYSDQLIQYSLVDGEIG